MPYASASRARRDAGIHGDDTVVELSRSFGYAQATPSQTAADRARPDAEPVDDLVSLPAEQPHETELAAPRFVRRRCGEDAGERVLLRR
jgi:hypothetical protein